MCKGNLHPKPSIQFGSVLQKLDLCGPIQWSDMVGRSWSTGAFLAYVISTKRYWTTGRHCALQVACSMATMDVIEIGVNLVLLRGSFNIHGTLTSIEMQEKVL